MSQIAICKMGIIKPNYIPPTAFEVVTFYNVCQRSAEYNIFSRLFPASKLITKKKAFYYRFIFTSNLRKNSLSGLQTPLFSLLIQQIILSMLCDIMWENLYIHWHWWLTLLWTTISSMLLIMFFIWGGFKNFD